MRILEKKNPFRKRAARASGRLWRTMQSQQRQTKPILIVIVGPNASGKSELAVKLAQKFGGEIVSGDSRQIYRGLDIATGKVPGRWHAGAFVYKGIPHHCIDSVSPKQQFTVSEYQREANRAIAGIITRRKLPILVGGTGFWIDAVARGRLLPAVPPDNKLRKRLEEKSAKELLQILSKLDPERASAIEQKNPRRLIRAIEIAKALGRVPRTRERNPYRLIWIGMKIPEKTLRARIRKRCLSRFRKGMIHEAQTLHRQGLSWKRLYELGLEYRFLADHLRGKLSENDLAAAIERADWDYARRQLVLFKKNRAIRWIQNQKDAYAVLNREKRIA